MKQFEKTMKPFEVRSYTKKELALAYFPDVTDPHMEELRKHGYQKNFRFFTPAQVRLIVYYLGEP